MLNDLDAFQGDATKVNNFLVKIQNRTKVKRHSFEFSGGGIIIKLKQVILTDISYGLIKCVDPKRPQVTPAFIFIINSTSSESFDFLSDFES